METFMLDRESDEAAEILTRTRLVVEPALRAAVSGLPGSLRGIAAYHFGWQDAQGNDSEGGGGKLLRPALVVSAAAALGGPDAAAEAVSAAVAVELVHNFTLLHDDVMDRDSTRHHRPTVWSVFGTSQAILAGDALHALGLRILTEDRHPAAGQAAARLSACVVELCDGQQADCSFEERSDVSLEECLAMAEAKTGALLGCACALGALYGGADEAAVEAMDAFGRQVGLAFQLIDDLIGIWGDPLVTGKPVRADIASRKKSLPVVAALRAAGPAAADLAAVYGLEGPLADDEVSRAVAAIDEAGGRDWAQVQACDRMALALAHLSGAVPEESSADDLLALAELVTRRNR
jgi:geranylgeranyl diphosphate synthase type I